MKHHHSTVSGSFDAYYPERPRKIQEHLEDPFDLVREDDVVINVEKFIARLEA